MVAEQVKLIVMNFRITIILISIFVLLAGVIIFFHVTRKEEKVEDLPDVWSFKEESIERFKLRLPKEKKEIAFFEEEKYKWHIDNKAKTPVDPDRWGGIVLLVSGPQSRRVIAKRADNLPEYGLTEPSMIITLNIRGEKEPVNVLVGDHTPNEKSIYVRLEGHETVYLLDHTWNDCIKRLVLEPPEKEIRSVITKKKIK